MTHEQIIRRFAQEAGKDNPKFLKGDDFVMLGNHEGYYSSQVPDTVFSYGYHFPLARIMPSADGERRGWWLLNGDRAMLWNSRPSPSTDRHQRMVQNALKATGLPMLTVPFSSLEESGIKADTIVPVDVLPERYTWEPRTRALAPQDWMLADSTYTRNWQQRLSDRTWTYEEQVHHLGESVFRADYSYEERTPGYTDLVTLERVRPQYEHQEGTAYFLSAFDENEPGFGLYFLAQLPDGAAPATVAEARECLKPQIVKEAEATGEWEVLRQGDVFALESNYQTRQLAGPTEHMAYVLDVNHQVTEVRHHALNGCTYGRGFMRHRPRDGRRPDHQTLKLGDGKTWYVLARNTVPEGRSWSIGGYVD